MPKKQQERREELKETANEPGETKSALEPELTGSTADMVDESGPQTATSAPLPSMGDMEAAMEEDIAGEATGVSRRNPEYASAPETPQASAPSMGFSTSDYGSPSLSTRTGAEEAEWFARFREQLMGASSSQPTGPAPQSQQEQVALDPDDPEEDEALNYSEDG